MADFDPLDRRIRESFSRITERADSGRVTAAVREKLAGEKERSTENGMNMRRSKKLTVLLAAALTVILLTTAAAAAVIAVQARMKIEIKPPVPVEFREGKEEYMVYHDVKTEEQTGSLILSDEVMATFESLNPRGEDSTMTTQLIDEGSVIPFDNWQEAADWLNCGLMVNPDLGTLPNENFRLHAYYVNGEKYHNRSISVIGTHSYPDTEERVYVDAFIPLNDEAWEIYNGGVAVVLRNDLKEAETVSDTLLTSLGDEATLVFTPGNNNFWDISAHFIHEGIIYRISVWTNDRAEGESVVRRVVENMG